MTARSNKPRARSDQPAEALSTPEVDAEAPDGPPTDTVEDATDADSAAEQAADAPRLTRRERRMAGKAPRPDNRFPTGKVGRANAFAPNQRRYNSRRSGG